LQALELKLVDELQTSDEYLSERISAADAYRFEYKRKKTMPERVLATAQALLAPTP
jgi:serine protease SohB